jgi:hypothetical protein
LVALRKLKYVIELEPGNPRVMDIQGMLLRALRLLVFLAGASAHSLLIRHELKSAK